MTGSLGLGEVSLSPETYLTRSGRDVRSCPIKGTLPRAADHCFARRSRFRGREHHDHRPGRPGPDRRTRLGDGARTAGSPRGPRRVAPRLDRRGPDRRSTHDELVETTFRRFRHRRPSCGRVGSSPGGSCGRAGCTAGRSGSPGPTSSTCRWPSGRWRSRRTDDVSSGWAAGSRSTPTRTPNGTNACTRPRSRGAWAGALVTRLVDGAHNASG